MDKLIYNGIHEISHEVQAWQEGNAEFDYMICGEYVVKDTDGSIKYVHETCFPTGDIIYIVGRCSAFDSSCFQDVEDMNELESYVIEEYSTSEEYEKSRFKPFFDALEKLTDEKFDSVMSKLDDTKNFPDGRSFGIFGKSTYAEWYCQERDEYFQIRENENNTIFSVSKESYYLPNYMGPFYSHYFHGKQKEEKYIQEVSSLEEFPWDSPYPFLFTQYRGIKEIKDRWAGLDFLHSDEEAVDYKDDFTPLYLRAYEQKGNSQAIVSIIGIVDSNNVVNIIYTAYFLVSQKTEYVVTTFNAESGRINYENDIIFSSYDIALKSYWKNYFVLLERIRKLRQSQNEDIFWRTGSNDEYHVSDCRLAPDNDITYAIWCEEIAKDVYDNPQDYHSEFEGKRQKVIDIINAKSQEDALQIWKTSSVCFSDIKTEDCENIECFVKDSEGYYHVFTKKISLHFSEDKLFDDQDLEQQ